MKRENALRLSKILLVIFYALLVGLLIAFPILDHQPSARQFWGWVALLYVIYTLGSGLAKVAEEG